MFRIIGAIILAVIFFTILVLAWLNTDPVTVDYLLGQAETSLSFILFVALLCGWLLGLVSCTLIVLRQRRESRRLKKEKQLLETELNNLRNLPLQSLSRKSD